MKKQHLVFISKPFEICKFATTNEVYNTIRKKNLLDDYPKVGVSWHDVDSFCKKLSELDNEYIYRLPTEAEWEYCCRANCSKAYYGPLDDIAWHNENSHHSIKIHPVGQKLPNNFGLYDMLGNIHEWCLDIYEQHYSSNKMKINLGGVVVDPQGPNEGFLRVIRGNAWDGGKVNMRAACRIGVKPGYRDSGNMGFRLVRVAKIPLDNPSQLC